MHIGFTYDLRSDYLAAGYGEEETAEFDQLGTIEAIDGALQAARPRRRSHRPRAKPRRAAGPRRPLGPGVQHLRRAARRGTRIASAGDSRRVRNPVHVCRPGRARRLPRQGAHENWCCARPAADARLARRARRWTTSSDCQLPFPVIAKPIAEGTGKGIDAASKVRDRRHLRQACQRLLERLRAAGARRAVFARPRIHGRHSGHRRRCRSARHAGNHAAPDCRADVYSYATKSSAKSW